jgi:hypothetical protein
MSEPLDWNTKTIAEFRENEGRVGGTLRARRWSWCTTAAARAGGSTSPR